ncbi:hypothetical protein PR048_008733 [Dryococelus australis]|uniref:Uncharacterized protein n=1 Tax=Dryococelus australis TaxID=614101 RepID=A0ABQ9HY07_9NEOP|nr:hypothetical protein PR048_008733 [Dryococelus australis]
MLKRCTRRKEYLRVCTLPFLVQLENPILQKDNARPHIAQPSLRDVNTLPWPVRSPDLLSIENILEPDWTASSANGNYGGFGGSFRNYLPGQRVLLCQMARGLESAHSARWNNTTPSARLTAGRNAANGESKCSERFSGRRLRTQVECASVPQGSQHYSGETIKTRCMQREPVTTELPRETECIPTAHKRAARDTPVSSAAELRSSDGMVRLLASHHGDPGSIPGGVAPGFSHVETGPDNAADRRIFSGISRSPPFYIPTPLHTYLTSPSLALKTLMLTATHCIKVLFHCGYWFLLRRRRGHETGPDVSQPPRVQEDRRRTYRGPPPLRCDAKQPLALRLRKEQGKVTSAGKITIICYSTGECCILVQLSIRAGVLEDVGQYRGRRALQTSPRWTVLFWGCLKSRIYSGCRSDTRDQLLQAITDATNRLRNDFAGMQWQHAMVGYNVSPPVYGRLVHILNSSCEIFNVYPFVNWLIESLERTLGLLGAEKDSLTPGLSAGEEEGVDWGKIGKNRPWPLFGTHPSAWSDFGKTWKTEIRMAGPGIEPGSSRMRVHTASPRSVVETYRSSHFADTHKLIFLHLPRRNAIVITIIFPEQLGLPRTFYTAPTSSINTTCVPLKGIVIKSREFGVSCDLKRQLGDPGTARDDCSDLRECVGELEYFESKTSAGLQKHWKKPRMNCTHEVSGVSMQHFLQFRHSDSYVSEPPPVVPTPPARDASAE